MKLGALGALGALAALSLLVVMTGPTEGQKISACDLKAELQKEFPSWEPFRIARVVCQVGIMSGLNTTLVRKCPRAKVATPSLFVNVISVKGGGMETLELRGEQVTDDPLPEEDDDLEEEEQEEGDDGDEGGEDVEDRRMLSKKKKKTPKKPVIRWCQPGTSYYGIFQLSDRIYCDSGENPTRNLCRTSCSAFTDDDITDDIRCVRQTGYSRPLFHRKPHHCRRYRCR